MSRTLRHFYRLTALLRVVLIVSVVVWLFAIIVGMMQLELLRMRLSYEVQTEKREDVEQVDEKEDRHTPGAYVQLALLTVSPFVFLAAAIGVYIQLAFLLLSLVVFLLWVYRANANLRVLGIRGKEFTPGWAVGWFFIPVANLWKPYQVMKELWQSSKSEWPDGWRQIGTPVVLDVWWAVWVLSFILGRISVSLSLRANGVDELYTATAVSLFSDGVDILRIALTIPLTMQIYRMQKATLERSAQQQPLPDGPSAGAG